MTDEGVRPFADWLRDQGRGATHDELSEALRDLVNAVRDTGKKGSLSLTVTVAPLKDGNTDVLLVSDEIKRALPKPDRKPSMFYPTADGNLSRTDPQQLAFDSLVDVSTHPVLTTMEETK